MLKLVNLGKKTLFWPQWQYSHTMRCVPSLRQFLSHHVVDYLKVVNWELEQPREEHPTWYHATHLAEQVLSKSDPLYRYYFPSNVQCSRARIQLGNKIALYNIMSATAWPLEMDEDRCPFTWLLEGSEEERRKIVGRTGCSPRLMHTFAQIAHLSAKLLKVRHQRRKYKNPISLTSALL